MQTSILPCRSPSSRADAIAALRAFAPSTRTMYEPGDDEYLSATNTCRIVSLFGQACNALGIGADDDVVSRAPDLCALTAGVHPGLTCPVLNDAPACARRVMRIVYGYTNVRALGWRGDTLLTPEFAGLLEFAHRDRRAVTHLTVLMRVVRHAFPALDAPQEMPSSKEIAEAAPKLPAPVNRNSVKGAMACYRKLRARAIAADPANHTQFAPIPDPRRAKGRGVLAALAASRSEAHRHLAENGDLKAAIKALAPSAYEQMTQYERNPRGKGGERHSVKYVAEMWHNMSGILGELYRHAPERMATFQIKQLWSETVEVTPAAAGLDIWNEDLVGSTVIRVSLARWLVDHCADSSRVLSTHVNASVGYTEALLTDVTGWWSLTELFHGKPRRANAPEEWATWQRTYADLRRDMRDMPIPKDERIEKATRARMELVSLPYMWCIGLPLLARDAERALRRYEETRRLAETLGHAVPDEVPTVRQALDAFGKTSEIYLMSALPWIDTMRFSQYRCGRWGAEFIPDYNARGDLIALHCNWSGKRLDLMRVKTGLAGRRAYGPGLLNLAVLQGYLAHVRAPRLMRLGVAPDDAMAPNGLYALFVSGSKPSLSDCAYSETTYRKARFGIGLYRVATEFLGHTLPPYEELDRARAWKGAWSLHEVRHDVATIVGALMGLWERACEMTMDVIDTLKDNYWERAFQPIGERGEWRCIETYYPWVRALLDDPRRAQCPLDDPAIPLPPGARATLDEWAAADAALNRKGRRSRHSVGDARMRHARPDVAERNRASARRARDEERPIVIL